MEFFSKGALTPILSKSRQQQHGVTSTLESPCDQPFHKERLQRDFEASVYQGLASWVCVGWPSLRASSRKVCQQIDSERSEQNAKLLKRLPAAS